MRTDGRTHMTKVIVDFRNLTLLRRSHFLSICSQTQKVSITQTWNSMETRRSPVALNQTNSKQRNNIFAICFESRNGNWIKQWETSALEGKGNCILQLHGFLVHYYYICYHIYARYLQLCIRNKPCLCGTYFCGCSVFTVCATCNVISPLHYVLYLYITTSRSLCAASNMAGFCNSLISYFPAMLLR